MIYFPDLPKEIDLFAFCLNGISGADFENEIVHSGHCYKVIKFVDEIGFFPYGVRIKDHNDNELNQTFFSQRFKFIEHYLN